MRSLTIFFAFWVIFGVTQSALISYRGIRRQLNPEPKFSWADFFRFSGSPTFRILKIWAASDKSIDPKMSLEQETEESPSRRKYKNPSLFYWSP